jgi:hypothetical protein
MRISEVVLRKLLSMAQQTTGFDTRISEHGSALESQAIAVIVPTYWLAESGVRNSLRCLPELRLRARCLLRQAGW